jgi:hypothetical protein
VYKEKNKPKYGGLERLHEGIENNSNKCYIIPYHIFDNGTDNPLIQIMFMKNILYETMYFIEIEHFLDEMKNKSQKEILKKSCDFMNGLLEGYCGNQNLSSEFFEGVFKGHAMYKYNTYLFFDISSIDISNLFISFEEMIWFGMTDEILNHKKICGVNIHHSITSFFKNHPYFLHLIQNETICDFPIVCYSGEKTMNKTKFVNIFGVTSSDTQFGDLYMLTDYESSSSIKHGNQGIVRFALFTKKMVETDNNCKFEFSEEIETFYQLKDNRQEWYFKSFTQQIPLTYHQIFHQPEFVFPHLFSNCHSYKR